jgi:hypothetical protein
MRHPGACFGWFLKFTAEGGNSAGLRSAGSKIRKPPRPPRVNARQARYGKDARRVAPHDEDMKEPYRGQAFSA